MIVGFVLAAALALWALFSARLARASLTAPMLFTGLGLALGGAGLDLLPDALDGALVHVLAELTLVVVLFSDASRVRWRSLSGAAALPARLLAIGMPLAVALGTLAIMALLPEAGWTMALLTAAILAPTDATLGEAVTTDPAVPEHVAEAIEVESGLNDGLALPLVIVAALAAAAASGTDAHEVPDSPLRFVLLQISLGPLVGLVVGAAAALAFDAASRAQVIEATVRGLFVLASAALAFLGAELVGGNGFVAAFVGGLAFGNVARSEDDRTEGLVEGVAGGLTIATYFVFGAVLAPSGFAHASGATLAVALLFLGGVRVAAIWAALIGGGLPARERLFIGWFGPRGLASILFALLVLERFELPFAEELVACVVLTVLLSIVLHGATAAPWSRWLGRH